MAKRKETECAVGNRQDEEEILKTYQTEDYDYLANSATGMDCTGLMCTGHLPMRMRWSLIRRSTSIFHRTFG